MRIQQYAGWFIVGSLSTLLMTACAPVQEDIPSRLPGQGSQEKTVYVPQDQQSLGGPGKPLVSRCSPNKYQKQAYQAIENRQYQVAVSLLERAIRYQPANSCIWYDLARVHYMQGNYQQSYQLGQKALRLCHVAAEKQRIEKLLTDAAFHMQ